MQEIEIGWYVRTKYGIFKIVNITRDLGYNKKENRMFELNKNIPEEGMEFIFHEDSPLLRDAEFSNCVIDLIRVGDYVNDCRVDWTNLSDRLSYESKCIGFYDGDGDIELFEKDIREIVTKEYFERGKYIHG